MLSNCKILTTRTPRVPSDNHTYVHICGMRHSQFSKSHDCLAGRWNEPTQSCLYYSMSSFQLQLASFLINAQPLPAHNPAADDNSLIGCTSHDLTYDWSLASTHFVDSQYAFRCSSGRVLLLNQMFWKQCTVRQFQSDLFDQSALEIRVRNLG